MIKFSASFILKSTKQIDYEENIYHICFKKLHDNIYSLMYILIILQCGEEPCKNCEQLSLNGGLTTDRFIVPSNASVKA